MKNYLPLLILILLHATSCKNQREKAASSEPTPLSVPEKIALAHGYDRWESVSSISFTFNVDRDTTHFERTWTWEPKSNHIEAIAANDTLVYNRSAMDSIALKTNAGFINDRYWLLAPFNLIWDANNYEFEHSEEQTAPISGETLQKLTIVYGNDGGYTPGDAYDFYFGDDFIIKEWVFRKSNQPEPSMATTWEKYGDFNGLLLPQDHRKAEAGFSINFTNIEVEMN